MKDHHCSVFCFVKTAILTNIGVDVEGETGGLVEAEFEKGRLDETAKLVIALVVDELSSST